MALKIRKLFNTMGDNCIMRDVDDYISSITGNRKISEELGERLIKKASMSGKGHCTACRPDLYWSHRKMGLRRGEQAALIALREDTL